MADCYLIPREERDGAPNIDGWIPMAHSHSELVDGVRDRIRSFKPDAKLSFRIRELHNLFQQAEEPRLQVEMILEEFYEGFNEIFFSTALQHHSKFKLIKAGTYEWEQRKDDFWGYTQVLVEVSCRQEIQANIHILERVAIEETYAQRMQNYLQILLHEMIHAFVQIYTCRCVDCFEKYKAYDAAGKTGHGRTWQVIAHAVQKFFCNELGLELDLYREDGLAREIHATRVEIPYRDCLDWELDDERVAALCEICHLKESQDFFHGSVSNTDDDQEGSAENENANPNIQQAPGRNSSSHRRICHFRPCLSACLSRKFCLAISFS